MEAHCGFSLYFLVVNEVKYLFILLFAIYKYTLVKCMFIYFLFHLMYCLLLLLLSFEISFYSPDINLFMVYGVQICIPNIPLIFSFSAPFFSLDSKNLGLCLGPDSFRSKGRLRNGYLGTRNRNFHRRESNVSTRRR